MNEYELKVNKSEFLSISIKSKFIMIIITAIIKIKIIIINNTTMNSILMASTRKVLRPLKMYYYYDNYSIQIK